MPRLGAAGEQVEAKTMDKNHGFEGFFPKKEGFEWLLSYEKPGSGIVLGPQGAGISRGTLHPL